MADPTGFPPGFPIGADVTVAQLEGTDAHAVLARLRASEPVSWVPALGGWLVTRRDLVLAAMRDPVLFTVDDPRFSTARVVGRSMLSTDGAEHERHRRPFDPSFGLGEVRTRFTAAVEAETERLIFAMYHSGAAELRRGFAGPLAVAVVAETLGLDGVSAPTVLSWYDAIVAAVSGVAAGQEVSTAGREAFDALRTNVEAMAARGPGDGAGGPSLLAAAGATGGLRTDEVVSNAAVLMFGGIETTEGMIANALWHLLSHPDQLALVRADPALVGPAIEESLRLEPAAAVVDRYATADVELGGAPIRRGDLIVVSLAGANRDPAVFADPDRYDVRRGNARQQVAFAHGPHVCLGMHLARLEAMTAIRQLLGRLPGLRLDPARPSAPTGLVFRKPPTLHTLWG
ncbi:cytochrome P450 [Actinopolymorpha sp. B17G11]|uniref:cytochrome P450 n=1 Tax=Actinopolymorpha sp. B17G11 TaxID=3160861 RepID=UPI0032E3F7B0